MDAEVEEMTRDRRNNILVHGLPVQVGAQTENDSLNIFKSNFICNIILQTAGG